MKEINISDVLSQAWELTKKHWATVLACMVGIYVVQYIISSIMTASASAEMMTLLQKNDPTTMKPEQLIDMYTNLLSSMGPAQIVTSCVNFILTIGMFQLLLNCGRNNGSFTLDAWKQPVGLYVKVFLTQIIVSIICGIGTLCCILPGIYLYARLQFTTYYFLDHKEAGIGEALSASWNMTSRSAWTLFGLVFIYVGIGIIGFLCCCIGMIPAAIIIYLAGTVCYLTLAPEVAEAPKAEVTE